MQLREITSYLTKLNFQIVTALIVLVAVSGAVLAQDNVRSSDPEPERVSVPVEEYNPVHLVPSEIDRDRFLREDHNNSCETNDLLYIHNSSSFNLGESEISNRSPDYILMSIWTREISNSLNLMCENEND